MPRSGTAFKKTVNALSVATERALHSLRQAHPDERFYFYALYTTADGDYVTPTAATEEGLSGVVAKYRQRRPEQSAETLARQLRFSAPDSPYHATSGRDFPSFRGGPALHEACFEALANLDGQGFFGRGAVRNRLIVNVVYGDMSAERWLAHARRLNPPVAVQSVMPYLRLHLARGNVSRWGAPTYQVNSLSLSANRKLVAYSGSGGEVGVLQVTSRRPLFEKQRKGQHWACALSPDGNRLYLGDHAGIEMLEVRGGRVTEFAKTGKPGCLAPSPDGTRLASASFDSPLCVFDTATGDRLWQQSGIISGVLGYSPDGKWLAIAHAANPGRARLTCVEAATGRQRWEAELGRGIGAVAWAPSGNRILAAASQTAYGDDDRCATCTLAWYLAKSGRRDALVRWTAGADAVAVAPSGERIGVFAGSTIAILDHGGRELARGTGTQESLLELAFASDALLLAAGRDVNSGPAILGLKMA